MRQNSPSALLVAIFRSSSWTISILMKLIDPVAPCVAANPVVPVVVSVVPQSQAVVVGVVVNLINDLKLLFGNKL